MSFQSNIICNNCVGARLYERSGMRFPNPFAWMSIHVDDFIKLANDFYQLDLDAVQIQTERFLKNDYDTVVTILPNDVKLHFIHYIQDDSKNEPTKENSVNIRYKNIIEYAKAKWNIRAKRVNCEPIFLYSMNPFSPDGASYNTILQKLLQVKKAKLIILVHNEARIDDTLPQNIRIVRCSSELMQCGGVRLVDAVKTDILEMEQKLRTPFLIGTRLFSVSFGNNDAVERSNNPDVIHQCAKIAVNTLVPSLLNQSYQDFQHFTIINEKSNPQLMLNYKTALDNAGLHTTLVTVDEWQQKIEEVGKCGSVITSRMDFDDFIKSSAVKEIRSSFEYGQIQMVGYRNGFILWEGEKEVRRFVYALNTGHIAIMQSIVADTSLKCGPSSLWNVYSYQHTHPEKLFELRNVNGIIRCLDKSLDESFIYVRHKNADSFSVYNPNKFELASIDEKRLSDLFGITIPLNFASKEAK